MSDIIIALDAMGGDHGPSVTVPAAIAALQRYKHLCLRLVGDESTLRRALKPYRDECLQRLQIVHASEVVAMDESPTAALRSKKDSSMRVAINLVKQGDVSACVSAGNTGALMATARFVLKTLSGIDRPAISGLLPNRRGNAVRVLDLGANIDSSAEHLFQFAVMGSIVAEAVGQIAKPTVGLLNVGEEEIKGNEQVKKTAKLLNEANIVNYIGYVEGNDIYLGDVDVVVCDGFVGNIALKTSEGSAKLVGIMLRDMFNKTLFSRFAALVAMPVLNSLRRAIEPGRYNGASLLGLQGIVVKSHGNASAQAFGYAISQAISEVEQNIPSKIGAKLATLLQVSEAG